MVASPEELNQWLQRTSGEATDVHVVTPGSDLLKDLRASVAAHKGTGNTSREPNRERVLRHVADSHSEKTLSDSSSAG